MIESLPRRIYRGLLKPDPFRRWTAGSRALPDFLVIGAMRGGTTSLHDLISSHPQVASAIKKEVHFFDLNFGRGERWYRAHFPRAGELRRLGRITGETTPYYLFHPAAPARAAALLPNVRVIAILRHPVERAYSHYWHSVRNRLERLTFEEALERETNRLAGEERKILAEPGYRSLPHIFFSYRSRSVYVDQLARWLKQVPRERTAVFEMAAFFGDPAAGSRRLFDFLGLDPHPAPPPLRLNEAAYPEMSPQTRAGLLDFFAPHNARLFELLGESFDWRD